MQCTWKIHPTPAEMVRGSERGRREQSLGTGSNDGNLSVTNSAVVHSLCAMTKHEISNALLAQAYSTMMNHLTSYTIGNNSMLNFRQ